MRRYPALRAATTASFTRVDSPCQVPVEGGGGDGLAACEGWKGGFVCVRGRGPELVTMENGRETYQVPAREC